MPKTASKKPITADKLGLAESMVDAGKKRRGRPKKLKTLEEVKADIDKRNPTYVSPVTGGLLPGTGPKEPKDKKDEAIEFLTERVTNNEIKITKLKNILKLRRENDKKDDVMKFLSNVLESSLVKIEENLSKILGNFDEQMDAEKEKQDELRVQSDEDSDKAREAKLEGKAPKEKSMLGQSFDKATAPVKGIFDSIMNFITNVVLGSAVMGLLKILDKPEIIMKPLRGFYNGIVGFINALLNGINTFVLSPINFIRQGMMEGIKLLLKPFLFLAKKFGADFDMEAFESFEVPKFEIPNIPKMEGPPTAEMQGGGEVPSMDMVEGGGVPGQGTGDTVPAMLEPGEFVMSKGAVQNEGLENLEQMNAEGGGTNKPIMKGGTTYAKGGGSIGIKGSGNTGKMEMKNEKGKKVGKTYDVVSGAPGTEGISQKMRKDMPGKGYPMPDGTYKVHSFDKHGPLGASLTGLGDWSAYVGAGDGNIGKRSGMMIHSDIDPYGTLGCIGVALGGKPGTKAEKGFLKSWNKANPETITVDFGAPSGDGGSSGGGLRPETSDNSPTAKVSSSKSGMTTPPGTPGSGGGGVMAAGGGSGGSGALSASTNGEGTKGTLTAFSSSDVRNDSNIIVQSIYNLVG